MDTFNAYREGKHDVGRWNGLVTYRAARSYADNAERDHARAYWLGVARAILNPNA